MDKTALLNFATSQVARLVMKLAALAGASETAMSQDKATQVAMALVTLATFGIELIQSHYAHTVTATKAKEGN